MSIESMTLGSVGQLPQPAPVEQGVRPVMAQQELAPGENHPFAQIYEDNFHRVFRFAFVATRDQHKAEDITQTTFLRAWGKFDTYEDRGFPISSWLIKIAKNEILSWHRKTSRRTEDQLNETIHDKAPQPHDIVTKKQDSQNLRTAIQRLKPKEKRVIEYLAQGLDIAEIAETLDVSLNAVRVRKFRAIANLRKILGANGNRINF